MVNQIQEIENEMESGSAFVPCARMLKTSENQSLDGQRPRVP